MSMAEDGVGHEKAVPLGKGPDIDLDKVPC